MALQEATKTAITLNWGTDTLVDASFRGARDQARPTTPDWDAIEQAMVTCTAYFARRGYSLSEESAESRYYVILWIYPQNRKPKWLDQLWDDIRELYAEKFTGEATGTGVASGSDTDDRRLTRERLARLSVPGTSRSGRPGHMRGGN